jgi:hypothetical protein
MRTLRSNAEHTGSDQERDEGRSMMAKRFGMVLSLALVAALSWLAPAQATTIILSGSDTISFHNVTSEASAAYKFLSNNETGSVLVVNDFGASNPFYGGGGFVGAATVDFVSPAAFAAMTAGDIGAYAGVMFASPSTCCSDPGAAGYVDGHAADLAAFISAGGNLYVEDYEAAAVWTTVIGFDGSGGLLFSSGCTGDPGEATPQGAAFGYVGGSFGCYTHQIYDEAFFNAAGGFVSLVNGCENPPFSATCATSTGIQGAVILGNGEAAVPQVPAPTALALVGLGLTGLSIGAWRTRTK